jgi:Na+-translocating ferredoxin:NAD+ oxidoreductase RnfD subunit
MYLVITYVTNGTIFNSYKFMFLTLFFINIVFYFIAHFLHKKSFRYIVKGRIFFSALFVLTSEGLSKKDAYRPFVPQKRL